MTWKRDEKDDKHEEVVRWVLDCAPFLTHEQIAELDTMLGELQELWRQFGEDVAGPT